MEAVSETTWDWDVGGAVTVMTLVCLNSFD